MISPNVPVVSPVAPSTRRRFNLNAISVSGRLGISGLLGLTLVSLVGPLFISRPRTNVAAIAQGPSATHWLGTDFAGRDNLVLLVFGGADMLYLAALAGLLTAAIAVAVGLLSGYAGGWIDRVLVWITDLWLTVPRFVLLLVIASLFHISSTTTLAVLIAIFGWPFLARQVRAQALSVRERDYVEAARLLRLRTSHILLRYIAPAIAPFIVISAIQAMTQAIYQQVGLAFFGIVPLTDNWGVLFSVAYSQNALYLSDTAWSMFAPVVAVCVLQLCLVLTSRSLEDFFDPRLRAVR